MLVNSLVANQIKSNQIKSNKNSAKVRAPIVEISGPLALAETGAYKVH